MRVEAAVGSLRRRAMYRAIRAATVTVARRGRVRIVHISVQRTHLHLVVEAANRIALARGMQGFQISAARHINTVLGNRSSCDTLARRRGRQTCRRGRVFSERYYTEIITSPTQAHRTIRYVLSNWRRHGEDRDSATRDWLVDPFSSAAVFDGWAERADSGIRWPRREACDELVVEAPTTWLLAEGWKRIGEISAWTVPGPPK
jgi:REP element-mobilizing transposase RayT